MNKHTCNEFGGMIDCKGCHPDPALKEEKVNMAFIQCRECKQQAPIIKGEYRLVHSKGCSRDDTSPAPTEDWESWKIGMTNVLRLIGVEDHIPAILEVIMNEIAAARKEGARAQVMSEGDGSDIWGDEIEKARKAERTKVIEEIRGKAEKLRDDYVIGAMSGRIKKMLPYDQGINDILPPHTRITMKIAMIVFFLIFILDSFYLVRITKRQFDASHHANCSTDTKTGRIVCSGYDSDKGAIKLFGLNF